MPTSLQAILDLLTGRCDAEGIPLGPRREPTRARIVNAATAVLLEHGYKQMRVDDVADAASVSRPTLYSYFASKELLLIAAMSEEMVVQVSGVAALFDETRPPDDRLRDWVAETLRYVVKAPLTARLARDRDPNVMRILTEHELARTALGMNPDLDKAKLFAGLVEEAFPGVFDAAQREEFASVLRALSHVAPFLLDDHALFGLSVDRLADRVSQLFVDGLRHQSNTKRC